MADNMVTLVGTIGQDPVQRSTSSGEVVNFSVATTERIRNPQGNWVDGSTSWFRVNVWGLLGRNALASLHKGQRVVVHGVIRINDFATGGGGTSRSVEVRATALGHDLAFGTSTFAKGSASVVRPPEATESTPRPAAAPERQLVRETVPAWAPSSSDDDPTPF